VPDPTRGVVTRLDEREVHGRIETVLAGMTADKRRVLVLRLLDQRSNAEVASHLGVPPNTGARARISRPPSASCGARPGA